MAFTILIVEDDADLRDTLAEVLRLRGYQVVAKPNGREAMVHLQAHALPCLILLDLMMPIMDGWDFRRALMSDPALRNIPTILLSGADDLQREGLGLRAVAYLRKPVSLADVLSTIERCAGEDAPTRA
jgi:CheY-like chemotaxis protein